MKAHARPTILKASALFICLFGAFDHYMVHLILYGIATEWKFGSVTTQSINVLTEVRRIAIMTWAASAVAMGAICVGLGAFFGLPLHWVTSITVLRVVFHFCVFYRFFLVTLSVVQSEQTVSPCVVDLLPDTTIAILPMEPRTVVVGFQDFSHKHVVSKLRMMIKDGELAEDSVSKILARLEPNARVASAAAG